MTDDEHVDNQINSLKQRNGAETDSELAKALQIGRSTIASWRNRGSVPTRYLMRKQGDDMSTVSYAPLRWTDEERQAFTLALLRFIRARDKAFDTYQEFLRKGGLEATGFWKAHQAAKRDIIELMNEEEDMTPRTAMELLAYQEFHPEGTG
ncbi:MAG: hypothetical protein CVT84_12565 [Alphaproteobacteria bacterium HGW-Alphaproteobacteria-6]|nr:MAG: hypothetical protein CVT84_12565 [Alphaproteobacteria bacterium HGW-Alphaproteobacteria-6]